MSSFSLRFELNQYFNAGTFFSFFPTREKTRDNSSDREQKRQQPSSQGVGTMMRKLKLAQQQWSRMLRARKCTYRNRSTSYHKNKINKISLRLSVAPHTICTYVGHQALTSTTQNHTSKPRGDAIVFYLAA